MAAYYLDTSALVKRYAAEQGTNWILGITRRAAGHELYTVRVTGPEMIAALFRKVRTGAVSAGQAQQAAGSFRADWQRRFELVEVSAAIADRAMSLAESYGLRGYDAVHLAAALELEAARRAQQLPALIFLSADAAQLKVAAAEGLAVDNPNHH